MTTRTPNRPKSRSPVERHTTPQSSYPFSAIVGQEDMKLALILNVIDPLIGGVLIMGHRGTGKSTAVRSLADLLPEIVVTGCPYRCDPEDGKNWCRECKEKVATGTKLKRQPAQVVVAELPLGATEDRVCGTIAIERALADGIKTFEPGLLARANRGFLYIDEVNLLEDHLVDLLLDVAATGYNKVERESISVEHPARFVLIGSGNPEEGELRPQLVDRFGLHVEVKTEADLTQRVEIVERRDAFDRDPEAFRLCYAGEQTQLRQRITHARGRFAGVKVQRSLLQLIAQLCSELKVDGHRGELTIMRAARALAAFGGRKKVGEAEVKRVSAMSLRHRLRRDVLEETESGERIEQALKVVFSETAAPRAGGTDDRSDSNCSSGKPQRANVDDSLEPDRMSSTTTGRGTGGKSVELPSSRTLEKNLPKLKPSPARTKSNQSNQIQHSTRQVGVKHSVTSIRRGRYVTSIRFKHTAARIALDATLRALLAAGAQLRTGEAEDKGATSFFGDALRFKLFKRKQGSLFIFAIDTSGSMARHRISQAKRVIAKLLRQSYLNRDSVAIVAFRGQSASVSLSPSRSILRARRVLDSLHMGGGTPLSAGLACTLELARRVGNKHGDIVVLLFTDGMANVPLRRDGERGGRQQMIETEVKQLGAQLKEARASLAVMETSNGFRPDVDARHIADLLNARFVTLHLENGK